MVSRDTYADESAKARVVPAEGSLPPSPEMQVQVGELGWLLPILFGTDTRFYGRWDYLAECWANGALPDAPIPRIDFDGTLDRAVWKMLTTALDAIPNYSHGGWAGWSGSEHFRFLMEWLLNGFSHWGHLEPPKESENCRGASERLTKVFDLALLQQHPYDYFGDLLTEKLMAAARLLPYSAFSC